MESRMDKYYREEDSSGMQRSKKNVDLYREIYRDYNSLENLPIPDNTNEIDIPELRKIVQGEKENNLKTREHKYDDISYVKEKPSPNKIHDINKLLEYAKNENNKLKDNSRSDTNNYKFLETLENKTVTKSDIKLDDIEEDISEVNTEDVLSQTREIKYQTKKISDNPIIEQIIPEDSKEFNTASLSLDILSDLKPNGDTGVTKPVKDPAFEKIYDDIKEDISEDKLKDLDEDIDIIKDDINTEVDDEKDSSFYTDHYKFSNKDFEDDEEEEESGSLILKIVLLIIFIGICGFAIYYFITNYGFN